MHGSLSIFPPTALVGCMYSPFLSPSVSSSPVFAAFEPSSCALFAHVVERTACTCLCSIKRQRLVPRVRQWLRRNSEEALEALAEDMAEVALDAINSIEPRLALILILAIWLRIVVVGNTRT
jgi:hypothetical protein